MIIEEGKFYRRADGSVHGPAKQSATDTRFPWMIGSSRYTGEGRFYGDQNSTHDLIAEAEGESLVNGAETGTDIMAPAGEADPRAAFAHSLPDHDAVNHPSHYNGHPSGVECIVIVEHMNFCRGNAIKYIWRAGEKGNEIEDLKKARWYLDREIERLALSA
jgi:hypothetical protein